MPRKLLLIHGVGLPLGDPSVSALPSSTGVEVCSEMSASFGSDSAGGEDLSATFSRGGGSILPQARIIVTLVIESLTSSRSLRLSHKALFDLLGRFLELSHGPPKGLGEFGEFVGAKHDQGNAPRIIRSSGKPMLNIVLLSMFYSTISWSFQREGSVPKLSEGVKKLVFFCPWPFQDGSLSGTLECRAS